MPPDHAADYLTAHCTIHDRSQFEVQFTYDIGAERVSAARPRQHFRVEAYHFFPTNLGISSLSFPKEAFYRSLYAYIRFKTPEISERELLDPLGRQSPLNALSFHLKQLAMGKAFDPEATVNEARLFGCVISSLLRARSKELEAKMQQAKGHAGNNRSWRELEAAVSALLTELPEVLLKFRQLLTEFRALETKLGVQPLERLRQVDEFLTYRFDHALADIHFLLQSTWESPTRLNKVADRLHAVAAVEAEHRQRMGYITLAAGDENALQLYTYRSGALKKIIDQVLYLDVKTIPEATRWKNGAAALGAMVAAIWAALTNTGGLQLQSQHIYLALTLFALAYVAKDRIKELLREGLWARISRFFPDNKLLIHDPTKDIDVGLCHERVVYMTKAKTPEEVLRVRNTQHAIDLDAERKESVILYQNDLRINARLILAEHERRTDIKHILRFSVEDLLGRLDNPTARVQFYDPENHIFCRVRAPKVYHINVVFRLTHWDLANRKQPPSFHRIRVVLDKNGIHRIDNVGAQADMGGLVHTLQKSPEPVRAPAEALGAEALGDEHLF